MAQGFCNYILLLLITYIMRNGSLVRKGILIKSNLKEAFTKHKALVIFILIAVMLGAVIAISSVCQNADGITLENCLDKRLVDCLCNKSRFISTLFVKLLEFVFVSALIYLCCYLKPLCPVMVLLFACLSFRVFFDVAIICTLFGLKGFIFCLLILLLFYGVILFSLLLFCCLTMECIACSRDKDCFGNCLKLFLIFLCLFVVCKLLQSLLFSFFSPILIIII